MYFVGVLVFFLTISNIYCQDNKDVLYGLPPLPLSQDEQAAPTTKSPNPVSPSTLFRLFTLPPITLPPLPRGIPYIHTYGVNPLPELPPQPESKYDGYFDNDGNFVPNHPEKKKLSRDEIARQAELDDILHSFLLPTLGDGQIGRNQIHGVKTFNSPLVKRDATTPVDEELEEAESESTRTTESTSFTTNKISADIPETPDGSKEVLVIINEDEDDKGAIFDETSLKENLKRKEVPALLSVDDDTNGGERVEKVEKTDTNFKAFAGGPSQQFQTNNQALPALGTSPDLARINSPSPNKPKRRRIVKNRREGGRSPQNQENKQTQPPPTTLNPLNTRKIFRVSRRFTKFTQRPTSQNSFSQEVQQFNQQKQFTQQPNIQTTHIELPPLNLPRIGQKIAQQIGKGGQLQAQQGQQFVQNTIKTTLPPLVTGRVQFVNGRRRVIVPAKTQKPVEPLRDIPPVPPEDLAEVQKNFVRVAPQLPNNQSPRLPAPAQQFQQQPQPLQQIPLQRQQFFNQISQTQFPPRPIPTTLPPPPRFHFIQRQPDRRDPQVQAYLKELEDYDWHLYYREQNFNQFRGRNGGFRIGGQPQATPEIQNGSQPQQPNEDYLKDLADYDDLQAIENRNHFAENPPQLHVELPTTEPTPGFSTPEALVPLGTNQVPTPPPTFNNNVNNNNQGPTFSRPAVQTDPFGLPSHGLPGLPGHPTLPPLFDTIHRLFGFRGPVTFLSNYEP